MKVPQFAPFVDMKEYEGIKNCFEENWLTEGPKAKLFEEKLRNMLNVPYSVFAPNGTLSLYLSLVAIGIRPGDEVIVPDTTFIASANAVVMAGAIPVFCDVNKRNFQIDVEHCHNLITEKTKAIMPVHLYGMCANMQEVKKFALKYNLLIIEDAAQALGVHYTCSVKCPDCKEKCTKKMAGTFGDVGSFSFFADKTLTTGEGGLIVTANEGTFHKLKHLRNQGRLSSGTFIHPEIGYNFRMTDIQMAIGLVQFEKFNTIVKNKLQILALYKELLKDLKEVTMIEVEPNSSYIPFRVTIIAQRAHELMKFLGQNEIQPRTFFYPMHKQPCFQKFKDYKHPNYSLNDKDFPNACFAYENGVCLPSFAALKEEQIVYVCEKIKTFYGHQ